MNLPHWSWHVHSLLVIPVRIVVPRLTACSGKPWRYLGQVAQEFTHVLETFTIGTVRTFLGVATTPPVTLQ